MIGVGALVVVIVAVVALRETLFKDRARPVGIEQAVDRYRGSTTTTATGPTTTSAAPSTTTVAVAVAEPGVYRYATTGGESVDALGGAHHDYPSETTITVTPDGCGALFRWDALKERRDEWRLCATPRGLVLGDGLQYHEFFAQPDPEDVRCPESPLIVPAEPAPGPAVTMDCTLHGDPWTVSWQVLGPESRAVGGTVVETVHVRQSVNDTHDLGEQSSVDWYLDAHGLPIYVTATKSSKSSSPVGPVLYQEQYTLQLESLSPSR